MHLDLLASRRSFTASAALVFTLSLAGCGGGGGDSGSSGTATTSGLTSASVDADADAAAKASSLEKLRLDSAAFDQRANQDAVAALSGSESEGCADGEQLREALQVIGERARWNVATVLAMIKSPCLNAASVLALAMNFSPSATAAIDGVAQLLNRNSLWGVAPSSSLSNEPWVWVPSMAEAGVTSVRNFYSGKLTPITAAGMSAVGLLQWNSGTAQTLPVDDLEGWRRYVTEQVQRYRGRVKYWEVWNEPPNFTIDKSPVSYAKVVAVAFEAAKAVDPSVQIGLAAKSNHVNYLAETIAAGAAGKYDFVTLHPYEVASLLPLGWEGPFMAIVPRLRKMLQDKDPAKATVPVWFTEIGYPARTPDANGPGPQLQADVLAKIYTMAIAQGVERTYWFDPRDSEGLTSGLTTADGSRRPAWYAFRSLKTHLGARPSYAGWTQPGGAYYGFVFQAPRNVVLSAWARAGQSSMLTLASDVKVVDPRTGATSTSRTPTVGEAPVMLVAPNGSPQAQQWLSEAAANTGKPFPWNGDHSASPSVQLIVGSTPDGVALAKPYPVTVVNNVPELNLDGSIGACFAVDPEFLSSAYKTTPIRITAEVRGLGTAVDPGFTLLYESDAPVLTTDINGLVPSPEGWFHIEGTTYYEKSWTVPNARFVGLHGFNFCFYTTDKTHSQFSVRRVTVSR